MLSISGVRFVNESLSVGVTFNLFRYLVLVAVTAENPLSHKYDEGKGSRTPNAFSLNTSYSL